MTTKFLQKNFSRSVSVSCNPAATVWQYNFHRKTSVDLFLHPVILQLQYDNKISTEKFQSIRSCNPTGTVWQLNFYRKPFSRYVPVSCNPTATLWQLNFYRKPFSRHVPVSYNPMTTILIHHSTQYFTWKWELRHNLAKSREQSTFVSDSRMGQLRMCTLQLARESSA